MYVIREMRLNKFEKQPVPSCRSLFQRLGGNVPESDGNKQTADCIGDDFGVSANKLQALSLGDKLFHKASEYAQKNGNTEPLDVDPTKL